MSIENFKKNVDWYKEDTESGEKKDINPENFRIEDYLDNEIISIKNKERKSQEEIKNELASKFKCNPDQISLGKRDGLINENIKLHVGDIKLEYKRHFIDRNPLSQDSRLAVFPEIVIGNMEVPEFYNNSKEKIEELLSRGRKLFITKFPKYISGDFRTNQEVAPEGTTFPKYIGGEFIASFYPKYTGNIKLPEVVEGRVGLGFGEIHTADGVELPRIIGGDLDLRNLYSAKGLKFGEIVNGHINLERLKTIDGLNLLNTKFKTIAVYKGNLGEEDTKKLVEMYPGKIIVKSPN